MTAFVVSDGIRGHCALSGLVGWGFEGQRCSDQGCCEAVKGLCSSPRRVGGSGGAPPLWVIVLGMFSHEQRLCWQDFTGKGQAISCGLTHKYSLDLMCC